MCFSKKLFLFFLANFCFYFQIKVAASEQKKDSILNLISKETNQIKQIDLYNTLAPFLIDTPNLLISNSYLNLVKSIALSYEKGIYESLHFIGVAHCEKTNFDSAIIYLTRTLQYAETNQKTALLIRTFNYLGIAWEGKANYSKALKYYFRALKKSNQVNDSSYILKSLNNIGVVYLIKNDYLLSEKYLLQAYKIANLIKSEIGLIDYNLAIIYLEKKEYKKALNKFESVLIEDINSKNQKNIAETYNNIGLCYLKLNDLKTGELYLNKAFEIRDRINDENGMRNSYADLALLHIKNKQFDKALSFLNSALILAKKTNNKIGQVYVYDCYIACFKEQNKYKLALQYTELKDEVLQEISNAENREKLHEFEKQVKIKQFETEKEISVVKEKSQILFKGIIALAIVLVVSIFAFLLFTIKNIKKNNVKLQENERLLNEKNIELIKQNEEILRSQEIAKEALKTKTLFIRNISHEIRTPLNAINGISELLENGENVQNHSGLLSVLKDSNIKLLALVNNILDFNALDSSENSFNNVPFSMSQIENSINEIFLKKIKTKGLEFRITNLVDSTKKFNSDPMRIAQVLTNFINNALYHTNKGFIELMIEETNTSFFKSNILFKVIDSGIGIPQNKIKDVFGVFSQVDNSNTRKKEGTGLGLAICQKIITTMGGKIKVESEVNKGSVFYFELPIDIIDNNFSADLLELKEKSIANLNVLIVEDSDVNVVILTQFLKKWHCTFEIAENGIIGLEKVKQKQYDAILMDIQMPEMDGITCTKEIRKLNNSYYKTVPIIAITAAHENTMKDAAFLAGMNDYILKPFSSKELMNKLNRIIAIKTA